MGKYTTILISQEVATVIRDFCKQTGRKISPTTEVIWKSYITSSMSGSNYVSTT